MTTSTAVQIIALAAAVVALVAAFGLLDHRLDGLREVPVRPAMHGDVELMPGPDGLPQRVPVRETPLDAAAGRTYPGSAAAPGGAS